MKMGFNLTMLKMSPDLNALRKTEKNTAQAYHLSNTLYTLLLIRCKFTTPETLKK